LILAVVCVLAHPPASGQVQSLLGRADTLEIQIDGIDSMKIAGGRLFVVVGGELLAGEPSLNPDDSITFSGLDAAGRRLEMSVSGAENGKSVVTVSIPGRAPLEFSGIELPDDQGDGGVARAAMPCTAPDCNTRLCLCGRPQEGDCTAAMCDRNAACRGAPNAACAWRDDGCNLGWGDGSLLLAAVPFATMIGRSRLRRSTLR
jgi:hypothetical protein